MNAVPYVSINGVYQPAPSGAVLVDAAGNPLGGASPLTTKGDIFGFAAADARVPVGSVGQVLRPDAGDANGIEWAFPGGGGWPAAAHQIGRFCADAAGTSGGSGLLGTMTEVDNSSGLNSASTPGLRFFQATAASINSEAYAITANPPAQGSGRPYLITAFEHSDFSATVRMFAGLTEDTTVLSTDSPTVNHIGIAFSTANSDANYQILYGTSGGTNRVDTGVAPVTNVTIIFRLWTEDDGASYKWEIRPDGGGSISASGAISSNLPPVTDNLHLLMGCRTLANSARTYRHCGTMLSLGRINE